MHGCKAVAAAAAATVVALGCGTGSDEPDRPAPANASAPSAGVAEPATRAATTRAGRAAPLPAATGDVRILARGVAADVGTRPKLRVKPSGAPPRDVRGVEIVELDRGKRARTGDLVTVRYTATTWAKAREFDATWDRGDVFPFVLGSKGVMPGFNEGVARMREGERKLVVIPPAAGYKALGMSAGVDMDETLVFVVDVVDIRSDTRVHRFRVPRQPGVVGDGAMNPKRKRR